MMGLYLGGGGGGPSRAFSLEWPASMQIYWKKESVYMRKDFNSQMFFWYTNIAAVSLFWNTKMAAMTSCENALYVREVINSSLQYLNK